VDTFSEAVERSTSSSDNAGALPRFQRIVICIAGFQELEIRDILAEEDAQLRKNFSESLSLRSTAYSHVKTACLILLRQ
jgi:hypothetical protein